MTRRFPRRFNVLTKPSRVKHLMCSNKISKYVGFRENPVTAVVEVTTSNKANAHQDFHCIAPSAQDSSTKKTFVNCSPKVPPQATIRLSLRMVQLITAAADHGQEVTMWGNNSENNKIEDGQRLSNGNITN